MYAYVFEALPAEISEEVKDILEHLPVDKPYQLLKDAILQRTGESEMVLKYTAGHINYGGRVTDDLDRRCLMTILQDYYSDKVMQPEYPFSESNIYRQIPTSSEHNEYMAYIKDLPINDNPEIFFLHENANITYAQNETRNLLNGLLELQPKSSSGGGQCREESPWNRSSQDKHTTLDLWGYERILFLLNMKERAKYASDQHKKIKGVSEEEATCSQHALFQIHNRKLQSIDCLSCTKRS